MRAHDLLNDNQRLAIVQTIRNCCIAYQDYEKIGSYLFYEPYAPHRKRPSLTYAVLSAFAPGRLSIAGIEVSECSYGRGMKQPELKTEKAIFHIKSHKARSDTEDVKKNCRQHNAELDRFPLFAQIVFEASPEGVLESICVVLYDSGASVVDRDFIFCKQRVP